MIQTIAALAVPILMAPHPAPAPATPDPPPEILRTYELPKCLTQWQDIDPDTAIRADRNSLVFRGAVEAPHATLIITLDGKQIAALHYRDERFWICHHPADADGDQ